jgi:nucleotide-binding universal stress UspA family protein
MKTNTPVGALRLVVPETGETMFEKIVVALDTDSDRSQRVIEAAQQLARVADGAILVAHIQEVERPAMIAATPRPGALQPPLPSDGSREASALVDRTVERLQRAGITAEGVVHPGAGSTARDLLQIADSFQATVIVVGDSGSRVSDVLLGGVAHKIVRDAACSVLLVR